MFLGYSPGWWADTVASYCPSRSPRLTQKNTTKHGEQVGEQWCIYNGVGGFLHEVLSVETPLEIDLFDHIFKDILSKIFGPLFFPLSPPRDGNFPRAHISLSLSSFAICFTFSLFLLRHFVRSFGRGCDISVHCRPRPSSLPPLSFLPIVHFPPPPPPMVKRATDRPNERTNYPAAAAAAPRCI